MVHVVVVIFDHLTEKWLMLWWFFLTIFQRGGSCWGGYFFPFARGCYFQGYKALNFQNFTIWWPF
jgi:hypothetical protein